MSDSNRRPTAYKAVALPLSQSGNISSDVTRYYVYLDELYTRLIFMSTYNSYSQGD